MAKLTTFFTWRAAEINAEIRRLQPDILISSRCGLDEDVISAEGHVISDPGSLWECCLTTNKSWGWNSADNEWKTPREAIMTFMTCLHNGGNFLLNIGPDSEGKVPLPAVELLDAVGGWVTRNSEAIFGSTPHPLNYADQKLSTGKGETVYVPLHFYYGPETVVAGIGNKVQSVTLLGPGASVAFEQIGDRLFLWGLPEEPWDAYLPIIVIKLLGEPLGIPTPLIAAAKY
jgi:alpha-L-fucosidase